MRSQLAVIQGREPVVELTSKSDVAIARHVLHGLGSTRKHVARYADALHVYNEDTGLWEKLSQNELYTLIQGLDGCTYLDGNNRPRQLAMTARLRNGVASCALVDGIVLPESHLDNPPKGIAFQNCFLKVDDTSISMTGHSPENRARHAMPYEFRPNAGCPKWRAFVDSLFAFDADKHEKIACLRQMLGGYVIGAATTMQKIILLLGEGRNGKSSLLEIIQKTLFLPGRVTAIPPQQFANEYYRAMLAESDVNIVSEMPSREILESETFKAIVTGDRITGRRPRGEPFDFKSRAGHIFAANNLPATTDDSEGFWRRILIIKFNRSFEENSSQTRNFDELVSDICTEADGIMCWALEGARELLERNGKVQVPSSSGQERDKWRKDNNPVASFVAGCCELTQGPSTKASEVYRSAKEFLSENGYKMISNNTFGKRLQRLGVGATRRANGQVYHLNVLPKAEWSGG